MTFLPQPTPFITTNETFTTAPTTGTTVDVTVAPMRNWTLVVIGTGAPATLWEVVLEGSLDGTVFSEILKHTSKIGDGQNLFSGTTLFPAMWYRLRCTVLTLGPATDIIATVLGQQ